MDGWHGICWGVPPSPHLGTVRARCGAKSNPPPSPLLAGSVPTYYVQAIEKK